MTLFYENITENPTGKVYTYSFDIKAIVDTTIVITNLRDSASVNVSDSIAITVAEGWVRKTYSYTYDSTAGTNFAFAISDNSGGTGERFIVDNPMVNDGATTFGYIPTVGSPVTSVLSDTKSKRYRHFVGTNKCEVDGIPTDSIDGITCADYTPEIVTDNGKEVYKVGQALATTKIRISGSTDNTNIHTMSVYVKSTKDIFLRDSQDALNKISVPASPNSYTKATFTLTPSSSSTQLMLQYDGGGANADAQILFYIPQLTETVAQLPTIIASKNGPVTVALGDLKVRAQDQTALPYTGAKDATELVPSDFGTIAKYAGGSYCGTFDGTDDIIVFSDLSGVTIISSEGTSTPSVNGNNIECTSGNLYNLKLSNGSFYPFAEGAGTAIYDVSGNENHGVATNINEATFWGTTQDSFNYNLLEGHSLYEHLTSNKIRVPYGVNKSPLSITSPSGYTKTSDNPAGSFHNNSENYYVTENKLTDPVNKNYDTNFYVESVSHGNIKLSCGGKNSTTVLSSVSSNIERLLVSDGASDNNVYLYPSDFTGSAGNVYVNNVLPAESKKNYTIAQDNYAVGNTLPNGRTVMPKRSYLFDGINDNVDLGRPSALNFRPQVDAFEIEGYFSMTSNGTIYSYGANTSSTLRQVHIFANSSGGITSFVGGTGNSSADIGLLDGNVHSFKVVVPASSTGLSVFVDGTEAITNGNIGSAISTENGYYGARTDGSSFLSNGRMFDIKHYSGNGDTRVLVAHHKMNETEENPIAYDSSGNSNHGTKNNVTYSTFHAESTEFGSDYQNTEGYSVNEPLGLIPKDDSTNVYDVLGNVLDYNGAIDLTKPDLSYDLNGLFNGVADGKELANPTTATYNTTDANNYSEHNPATGLYHIVSDGTFVDITFGNVLEVGKEYELVLSDYSGTGQINLNNPSWGTLKNVTYRFVATAISLVIKRGTACNVYFKVSVKEVSKARGYISFEGLLINQTYNENMTDFLMYTRENNAYGSDSADALLTFATDVRPYEYTNGEKRFDQYEGTNKVLNSEDLSQPSWVLDGTATVTGTNTVNLPAVSDSIYASTSATAGETIYASIKLSGSGDISILLNGPLEGSNEEKIITLTTTPTTYYMSHSQVNTELVKLFIKRRTGQATEVTATEAQISKEVIPYIPTTASEVTVSKGINALLAEDITKSSYLFDSSSVDKIDTNNAEQGGSEFSVAFTINPTALSGINRIIDKYNTISTGRAYRLFYNSNGDIALQISSDGLDNESFTFLTSNMSIGTESKAVVTYKDGVANMYIGGSLIETHTYTITSVFQNSTTVLIGDGYSSSAPCSAYIWDARLFSKELSTTEVTAYQSGASITGAILDYRLSDYRKDTFVQDYSGNNNHGTASRSIDQLISENDSFGYPIGLSAVTPWEYTTNDSVVKQKGIKELLSGEADGVNTANGLTSSDFSTTNATISDDGDTSIKVTTTNTTNTGIAKSLFITSGEVLQVKCKAKSSANQLTSFTSIGDSTGNGILSETNPSFTTEYQDYVFVILPTQTTFRMYASVGTSGDTYNIKDLEIRKVSPAVGRVNFDKYTLHKPVGFSTTDTFPSPVTWTATGSSIAATDRNITVNNGVATDSVYATNTFSGSNIRRMTITVSNYVSGDVKFRPDVANKFTIPVITGNGVYHIDYVTPVSGSRYQFYVTTGATLNFHIDSDVDSIADNLVTNGTFDSDTIWTRGIGWTISGGTLSCDGTQPTTTFAYALDGAPNPYGKVYIIRYTALNVTAGTHRSGVGGYTFTNNEATNGTFTKMYIPTNPSSNNNIYVGGDVNFIGSIDNIQVVEVVVLLSKEDGTPLLYIDPFDGLIKGYDGVNICISPSAIVANTESSFGLTLNNDKMYITKDGIEGTASTFAGDISGLGNRLFVNDTDAYSSFKDVYFSNDVSSSSLTSDITLLKTENGNKIVYVKQDGRLAITDGTKELDSTITLKSSTENDFNIVWDEDYYWFETALVTNGVGSFNKWPLTGDFVHFTDANSYLAVENVNFKPLGLLEGVLRDENGNALLDGNGEPIIT